MDGLGRRTCFLGRSGPSYHARVTCPHRKGRLMVKKGMAGKAVVAIAERDEWSKRLREIASKPLEFSEDFPTIAKRYEAWWKGEMLDRPVFAAEVAREPGRVVA
jgi:hypothetical protein